MANWLIEQTIDLQRPKDARPGGVEPRVLTVVGDDHGHVWRVTVLDGGVPAELTGTVEGWFQRADGATVVVVGTLSGHVASVTLADACCAVEGPMVGMIRVSGTGGAVTLAERRFLVRRGKTDSIVDPGHAFPSLEAVAGQYAGLQQAYSALAARLETAIAAVSSDTELTDIRVRADGMTESTAGGAVRAQFEMARDSDYAVYEHVQDAAMWTNGGYSISGGARGTSETAVRSMLVLVTDTFLPESWGIITVDGDDDQRYGFRLHGWDASGSYAGFLVPGTWEWSRADGDYVRGQMPVRINLDKVRSLYPGYRFKILVRGRSHDPAAGETLDRAKALIHVWEKRVHEAPKDIDWGWSIGGLNGETGLPNGSTNRIRSFHIPCGAGTRLTFSGLGYAGMQVFEYGPDWTFAGGSGAMVRRWTVHSDGFIRVLVRKSDDSTVAAGDVAGLAALVTCVDHVPYAFQMPDGFEEYGWAMGGLSGGAVTSASRTGLVMRKIMFARTDTAVVFDPDSYHASVARYSADGTVLGQSPDDVTRRGMICIPKGSRYRLRMKAVDESTATPGLLSHFAVREMTGDWWYGVQSLGEVRFLARSHMLITPSIRSSGRGLTARCMDSAYSVSWNGYDSDDPDAAPVRRCDWASEAHVDPGCFYRLMIRWTDPDPVEGQESVVSIPAALRQLVIEKAEDVDPGIAAAGIAAKEAAGIAAEIARVKPSQGLIADVTVAEDTAELVIDTDTDGNAFELTDMLVELRTAAGSGSGYVTCMAYMGYPHDGWRYLPTQTAISASGNWETIYMTMRIGGAMFFCATTSRENGGTANNLSPFAYLFEDTNIKKVRFTRYSSTSPLIPAGTRVRVYGVRAAADDGGVPGYYRAHIAAKAAEINGLRQDGRVQFAFITDYHINGYGGNTGHSGALLQYLADNTMLDLCVNGGDVASGLGSWDGDTADKALFRRLTREACAAMSPMGMVPLYTAGNHDGGISGGVTYSQLITMRELYMASGLQALRGHAVADPGCPLQYYLDDPVRNVRYIVAALGLTNTVTGAAGPTDADLFRFLAAALRTAPAGCGIIIFNHIILTHPTTAPADRTVLLAGLADAYNARNADYTVGSYAVTRSDFSGCTGRVLAIIGGHSHFDYSYDTTGGIPVIVTTTDNAGGAFALDPATGTAASSPRETGGIEEQAFDVFTVDPASGAIWATRIGGGQSREWIPE